MTRRLLAAFVTLSALVLAVLVIPLGISNQRSQRKDLTRRVEHDAVAVASIAADTLRTPSQDSRQLTSYLTAYMKRTGARVVVVDSAGKEVVDTNAPLLARTSAPRDFSSRPEIRGALDGTVMTGERYSTTLGQRLLYVTVPVTSGGVALGAVRVSYSTIQLSDRIRSYWYGLLAISLAVLAIASIIGSLIARWLALPLARLSEAAEAMGEGDLSVRADITSGPPEVRHLGARFNQSVATIERLVIEQRDFVADASHQLRTPLQALRLRLDTARYDVETGRSDEAGDALDRAVVEVDRLATLVTALLVLERADQGDATPLEDVDITDLVDRRAPDWSDLAGQRGVSISVKVDDDLIAMARTVHVEQALDNLVDNAIAVSSHGSPIEVAAGVSGANVEIHVTDHGPGMSDEQIEQAFHRFASGTSATGSSGSGGFGIGLAIVRRLTEIDGGTVRLTHTPGGGIDAVLTYPQPR